MAEDSVTAILDEYDSQDGLYKRFTTKVKELLAELLEDEGINPHTITSRVKDRASLKGKLERSERQYENLSDVPDIAGVRITTYFADDGERVAKLIEDEFEVDSKLSEDKGKLLDPDRFGYVSRHFIVKLSPLRLKLREQKAFAELKLEIQVRSILQHAWAEIEHDLGYKSEGAVPREIRRRFSRLASLLELADDEFSQIRKDLAKYTKKLPKRIREDPQEVLIDKESIQAFINTSETIKNLDRRIAKSCETKVEYEDLDPYLMDALIAQLTFAGFQTVHELEAAFTGKDEHIIRFMTAYRTVSGFETKGLVNGISLFMLARMTMVSKKGLESVSRHLQDIYPGASDEYAEWLFSAYEQVFGKDGSEDSNRGQSPIY